MAKNHTDVLRKLKAQVRALRKREDKSRNQLRAAFKKIHKLGTVFTNKLNKKIRVMQHKVITAQTLSYAKAAADFERQILKGLREKTKAVEKAIAKFEKSQERKVTKKIKLKAKKSARSKSKNKHA